MRKRIAAAFFVLLMFLVPVLSSCGSLLNEDEMGTIQDITIDSQTGDEAQRLFVRQDCPFTGYAMQKIKFYSAMMTLEVPSDWRVETPNPSQVKISVPLSDPNFPGNTFYIQCLYDCSVSEDELDPESGNIEFLYKPFNTYIEGLTYSIGGSKSGSFRRWRGGWDYTEIPEFVDADDLALTTYLDNEVLYDYKTGDLVAQDVSLVATFFKWQDFPVMISTCIERNMTEEAAVMMEFIMSTAEFRAQKISNVEKKEIDRKLSTSLPAEFKPKDGKSNIFLAPYGDTYATSGMGIGVYEVSSDCLSDTLSAEDIADSYAEQIAYDLMDPRYQSTYKPIPNLTGEGEKSFAGEDRSLFLNCNFITNKDARTAAASPYGSAALQYIDLYIIDKGDKGCFLIAALFSRHQAQLAYAIEKIVIGNLIAR